VVQPLETGKGDGAPCGQWRPGDRGPGAAGTGRRRSAGRGGWV
jgi:hypothetical protein